MATTFKLTSIRDEVERLEQLDLDATDASNLLLVSNQCKELYDELQVIYSELRDVSPDTVCVGDPQLVSTPEQMRTFELMELQQFLQAKVEALTPLISSRMLSILRRPAAQPRTVQKNSVLEILLRNRV